MDPVTLPALGQDSRRTWPVVLAVQLGVLLAALEATIVGTALPTIIGALGGVRLYPWAFSAYMLASTVVMPVFGGLSDRVGRKGPFLAAVAIFAAGSLWSGVAGSMPVLVGGRLVQGIGAGGILALSLIIFGDLFAGPRRGRMQGLITGVWGVASLVGPLLGGLVVDGLSWRWVFLGNVPLGAVVALLAARGLRETAPRTPGRSLDLPGAVTFMAGMTALMLALLDPVEAGTGGGAGLARLAALVAAGLGLAGFVRLERQARDPLLPPALFRDRAFTTSAVTVFFSGAAMFGALVHVPLLVQWGQGTDATTAGFSLMAMSTGWSVGGLVAGQLVHRLGFSGLAIGGMTAMVAGCAALAVRVSAGWTTLMAIGGVVGLGMGLVSVTLLLAVQTLVAPERRGVATSGLLFFRNVGATLGVAVMGAVLTARLGIEPGAIRGGAGTLPPGLAASLVAGMGPTFQLGALAALAGLVATWFLPTRGGLSWGESRAGERRRR
jgi:EmrB/QacA subfamily drug resistance transporter